MCLDYKTDSVAPVRDQNESLVPPPSGELTPQTPEQVSELIDELDRIRTEKGQLMADRSKMHDMMHEGKYKSNVRREWEQRRQMRELDDKETAITTQLKVLINLLPPEQRPPTIGFGVYSIY